MKYPLVRKFALRFLLASTIPPLAPGLAVAATHLVDATPGAAAFQTIQSALNQAQPGDIVRVRKGVYRERVSFKTGGSEAQPSILEGEEGAVIDGSDNVTVDWQPAPDVGPGVYRAAMTTVPFTVIVHGQWITTLDERRVDPAVPHNERDDLRWPVVFNKGAGAAGWDGLRAVTMYRKKEMDLLIRFKDQLDPRPLTTTVGPKQPTVKISGVNYCVVRGLGIKNSAYGVVIDNSTGSIVENCKIGPADYGIQVVGASSLCTLRYNDITLNPYAGADPFREGSWDNWEATKNGGYYDRTAIQMMPTKGGHQIHDNYIHDHWDGIESGIPGPMEDNVGLDIHHNFLSNLFDDAMETSGMQTNNRWHENIIEKARIAIRIKDSRSGPFYIYKNIFIDNRNDMLIFPGKTAPPEMWAYHNTSTSDTAIGTNFGRNEAATTPDYHFFNNLFWCQTTMRRQANYPLPAWKADYNVFVRHSDTTPRPKDSKSPPLNTAERAEKWEKSLEQARQANIDVHSTWIADADPGFVDAVAKNLALTEKSPARGKGTDLSKIGTTLPGISPGYFKGEQPDAGALQFGESMPKLPRKPEGSATATPPAKPIL